MRLVCLDLEGVLVPEIWIEFSKVTNIDELRLTTRDIADYDVLMNKRLNILKERGLTISAIQEVILELDPLPGAKPFLDDLRREYQVVILSDTFYEFASPLMEKLGWPTLFCHRLEISSDGSVEGYVLRQKDPKRQSVKAFKNMNYTVLAAGDSYNDTTMLAEADAGFLFRAPDSVITEFPQYPCANEYSELRLLFDEEP
ncbi:MAG: bifunctional phosphoserine phosphatase/homoserine phosphotransferase ThrH [Gammaproteobacteria bacterium]|nr:bifunctional phosphoserine phosphatase/homoserine phosphotransferase ThrH [Gammaproteobacteria bacterium]